VRTQIFIEQSLIELARVEPPRLATGMADVLETCR
jgi:hypothetical protein